jgi:hypothetical protein
MWTDGLKQQRKIEEISIFWHNSYLEKMCPVVPTSNQDVRQA